jgi:hypothetical protein
MMVALLADTMEHWSAAKTASTSVDVWAASTGQLLAAKMAA